MKNFFKNRNKNKSLLKGSNDLAECIVETVREPLIVLDLDLRVVYANTSFYQKFSVTQAETEGQLLYSLGNNQWNIPRLRYLLENIIPQNTQFNDFEVTHEFDSIGKKTMHLNARKIIHKKIILLAIEDITERINNEKKLKEKNEALRTALSEIKELQGILPICSYCKKIRNDAGYWEQIEVYIHNHTDADFSHSICPECFKKNFPEFESD